MRQAEGRRKTYHLSQGSATCHQHIVLCVRIHDSAFGLTSILLGEGTRLSVLVAMVTGLVIFRLDIRLRLKTRRSCDRICLRE